MSTVKTFMTGVVVGAALGVLFAPAKGSKTRRRIAQRGNSIRESWNEFTGILSGAIQDMREEAEELANRAAERIQPPQEQEQWRTT